MKSISQIIILFLLIFSSFCLEYEEIEEENIEKIFEESSNSKVCIPSNEEVDNFIKKNNISYTGEKTNNLGFIVGKCNPIILVPGIYSTRLKVRLNCLDLKRDENALYKKIKFYCSKFVCENDNDDVDDKDLWFNVGHSGFTLFRFLWEKYKLEENQTLNETNLKDTLDYLVDWDNYEAACTGFFMTMFDNETECPISDNPNQRICGYSENIRIIYDGGFGNNLEKAECGVDPIRHVLLSDMSKIPKGIFNFIAKSSLVFENIINRLINEGYESGFSLAAVPYDFRKFISTNNFAYRSLKYHIERMFNLTGKPVVIIAHSFGNLVTLTTLNKLIKEDENIKNMVKKWISIAPPFAGATKAADNFLHGINDFDFTKSIKTKDIFSEIIGGGVTFEKFGQNIMLKSIPTVYELRPFTIFSKLFSSEDYTDFANAIRKRIDLEKNCRDKECSIEDIEKGGEDFDKYFSDYFPSLKLDQCKYEKSVGGNQTALNKKCMTEIYNLVDYPSIIKTNTSDLKKDKNILNIENYYKMTGEDAYYPIECKNGSESNCLDKIFLEIPYVYEKYKARMDYLLERYKRKFQKKYGELTMKDFETREEIISSIQKMLDYQNKISEIKDLPPPPVDIDLIYGSFFPTLSAEYINKENLDLIKQENKGGDGTVPTWSSLMTALKWIYDIKTKNLTQKIRLVEYCSRLANSNLNLTNFIAIECECIKNNVYEGELEKCGHQGMLNDKNLANYIVDEIQKDEENITHKKTAIENYSSSKSYVQICNNDLYVLTMNKSKDKCYNGIEVTKEQYGKGFCQTFSHMDGRECCTVRVTNNNNYEIYYCDNVLKTKEWAKFYKNEIKENILFQGDLKVDVSFDCYKDDKGDSGNIGHYINMFKTLFILIILLI